tara:strand:- start:245 stop:1078 length:834 start_codon:yes stop_codon:yes gene_type:complete
MNNDANNQRIHPVVATGVHDASVNVLTGTYPENAHLLPLAEYEQNPDCLNFNKIKDSHVVITLYPSCAGGAFLSYLISLDKTFVNCFCENSSVDEKFNLYKDWLERLVKARVIENKVINDNIWFELGKLVGLSHVDFNEYLPNCDDNVKSVSFKGHAFNLFNVQHYLKKIANLDIVDIKFGNSERLYHQRFQDIFSKRRNRNGSEELLYLRYIDQLVEEITGKPPAVSFEFSSWYSKQAMTDSIIELNEKLGISIDIDMAIDLTSIWLKAQGFKFNE